MTFTEAKKHLEPYSPETRTGDAVQVLLAEIESLRGALKDVLKSSSVDFANMHEDDVVAAENRRDEAYAIIERTK